MKSIKRFVNCIHIDSFCFLTASERNVLTAILHLQHNRDNASIPISIYSIMMVTGMGKATICEAKSNLMKMGILSVVCIKELGTVFIINEPVYRALLREVREVTNPARRFNKGNEMRLRYGLRPLHHKTLIRELSKTNEETVWDMERKVC